MLNKMPKSTLRDAMWHEMLRLCSGRNDWQNRRPQPGQRRFGDRRDRVQEDRIDVRLSKDSTLCLALVEAPDMASDVVELARQSRHFRLARGFAEWILDRGIRDRGTLVRTLATDRQARDRFYNLFDGIEHIPARERTLAGARELLSPNREAARKQRLTSLLASKRSLADLSPEERQELKALSGGTDD